MQLENTFTVKAPLAAVWAALQDPQVVAPCFPGGSLRSSTGDSFEGDVKLKVGPITMNYTGTGNYLSRDDATHTVVIDARGRDAKGQGTAAAKVTGTLAALTDDETEVKMLADLTITGRAAQFGRAVIVEVADRIVAQFAERLARTLAGGDPSGSPVAAAANAGKVTSADEEEGSLNLLSVAVVPALKHGLPLIIGALTVLAAILMALRGRKSSASGPADRSHGVGPYAIPQTIVLVAEPAALANALLDARQRLGRSMFDGPRG